MSARFLKVNGYAYMSYRIGKIQYFRYMHIIWHIIYNYTHFIIPFKYSGFVDTTFLLN